MIRVFIGYDPKEPIAFHVLSHSIMRRASEPVSITPVALSQLRGVMTRPRHDLQSTEFSFSRFLVPYLCGFYGWAIFMDCDQLCLGDIARLWNYREGGVAVKVVKHDHKPKEATKFLGQAQTSYPMKNWSSVMLMNCQHCLALTPAYINEASGLDLHRFNWLSRRDVLIGDLPPEWNHLVGYDDPDGRQLNLHFTEGGPWFPDYADVPFAQLWRDERDHMLGIARR